MNGRQVSTLEELAEAANAKRAIVVPRSRCFENPRPAAFAMNLSGTILLRLFGDGMFIYEKPKERKVGKSYGRKH